METAVLLVDDHPVVRKGLRLLLEDEEDVRVVGEAGDGQAAIAAARDLSPDLVVMDVTMPDVNGIEATRQIVSEFPNIKVVALSIHLGRRFVDDMLQAGAVGYILKESAPEELVNGIRAVMHGGVFLSAAVSEVVVSRYIDELSRVDGSGKQVELTAREKEVLRLTVDGESAEETASALQISPKTVESVRRRIMRQLGVSSISELTEHARSHKWAGGRGRSDPRRRRSSGGGTHSDCKAVTELHRRPPSADLVSGGEAPEAHGESLSSSAQALHLPLTNREEEVLELLGQRLRDKEIAERLFVASETVRSHVKHIYQKLHVNKRQEAVAEATRLGLFSGR